MLDWLAVGSGKYAKKRVLAYERRRVLRREKR